MKNSNLVLAALTLLSAAAAPAAVLINETFSTDGTLADYSGAGKVFSAYTAVSDGTGSVSGGKLNMQMLTDDTVAGDLMYAHIDLGAAKPLVSLKMDVKGVQYSSASGAFQLYMGSFDTMADFVPGWNPAANGRNWAKVVVTAGSPYTVAAHRADGTTASTTSAMNQYFTWSMFLNQSGASQDYKGPDGATYSVAANTWSFFVGNTLVGENLTKGTTGDSTSLMGMVLMTSRNYAGGKSSTDIDNIVVRDDLETFGPIPEPTSLGLLGLGALTLVRRRRD